MATSKPTSTTGYTLTTTIQPPPGPNTPLTLPTSHSDDTPASNPPTFNDAIQVRTRVFIDEQHCSPEGEIDSDDPRSWQWVIYDSPATASASANTKIPTSTSTSTSRIPIAVIRLVPPPHAPHALLTHPTSSNLPPYDFTHEPYIKLTRVAVLPAYRGRGLGKRLVETALTWAAGHAGEIDNAAARVAQECKMEGEVRPWRGLVLVHAQVDVEKMYEGLGFVREEGLGRWEEEGIMHVGMFRRVEVQGNKGGELLGNSC